MSGEALKFNCGMLQKPAGAQEDKTELEIKKHKKTPSLKKKGSCICNSAVLLAEEFLNTVGAHVLPLEVDHVLGVVAEDAGGLIFL